MTMVLSLERWVDKVAVVTGASAGIGAAVSELLVKEGIQVVGLARRKNRLDELSKQLSGLKGSFHGIQTDMAKEEDILAAFEQIKNNFGPVHILINNAGHSINSTLCYGDTIKWKSMLDVNVLGLCIATREATQSMIANKIDGQIIHINSIAGHKVPNLVPFNIYPASKFAVTALTESMRNELNYMQSQIKVTSISPGCVETEFFDVGQFPHDHEQLVQALGKSLKAEDVADAILYVLSTPPHVQGLDMSRYVTDNVATSNYNLYAISNHSGSTYSGHYTTYCRHPYTGLWHEYNESKVSSISPKSLVSGEAYVLFYEQEDKEGR